MVRNLAFFSMSLASQSSINLDQLTSTEYSVCNYLQKWSEWRRVLQMQSHFSPHRFERAIASCIWCRCWPCLLEDPERESRAYSLPSMWSADTIIQVWNNRKPFRISGEKDVISNTRPEPRPRGLGNAAKSRKLVLHCSGLLAERWKQ